MNCTYNNYTEAVATCSAAQQHSIFALQILYKLYSLQLNCTYSNYTEAAYSAAQQHSSFTVQIQFFYSEQIIITIRLATETDAETILLRQGCKMSFLPQTFWGRKRWSLNLQRHPYATIIFGSSPRVTHPTNFSPLSTPIFTHHQAVEPKRPTSSLRHRHIPISLLA